jgi:hypothetical protein
MRACKYMVASSSIALYTAHAATKGGTVTDYTSSHCLTEQVLCYNGYAKATQRPSNGQAKQQLQPADVCMCSISLRATVCVKQL